jgi:hypothetical protein
MVNAQAIGSAVGWNADPTRPPLPPKGETLSSGNMPSPPVPPPRRHRLQAQPARPFHGRQQVIFVTLYEYLPAAAACNGRDVRAVQQDLNGPSIIHKL